MTRGNFDFNVEWDGPEGSENGGMEDGFDLLPPDLLEAGVEMTKNIEEDVEPYPGQVAGDKPTDPDEWHH